MASSNKGIWLVLGTGAALGLAIAVYYVTVLGPRGDRNEMRDQIARWDTDKWQPTRACLVGNTARAVDGYDALVLRAAIPGSERPRANECTAFFADLTRPGEVSSGNASVEADWRDLRVAIGTLANRYAGYSPDRADDRDALGSALDQVDAAYAALRRHAGMKPSANPASQPPIRDATPVASEVSSIEVRHVEQFGAVLVVHGSDQTGDVVATVRGPSAVTTRRLGDAVTTLDGAWGAWTTPPSAPRHVLSAGPVDPSGRPAGDGAAVQVGTDGEVTAPIFALGDGAERVLLYQLFSNTAPALTIARSHDGGVSWPEHTEVGDGAPVDLALDPTRMRADLTWTDDQGAVQWLALDEAALAGPLAPRLVMPPGTDDGSGDEVHGCLGAESSWWLSGSASPRLFHAPLTGTAPATPIANSDPVDVIVDCNDSRLLGLDSGLDTASLFLCTTKRCLLALAVPVAGDGQLAAILGSDGPVAATLTNDLLVLWRGDQDQQRHDIFRLADVDAESHLRALVEWHGLLHAVLIANGKLRLVALPAATGSGS